jgi:hypothetical protein
LRQRRRAAGQGQGGKHDRGLQRHESSPSDESVKAER